MTESALSLLLCTWQRRLVRPLIWCTSCLSNLEISHRVTACRYKAKLSDLALWMRNNTIKQATVTQTISTRFVLSLLIIYLSAESSVHLYHLKRKYLQSWSDFKHRVCFRTDLRCSAFFFSDGLTVEIFIKTAALGKSRQQTCHVFNSIQANSLALKHT